MSYPSRGEWERGNSHSIGKNDFTSALLRLCAISFLTLQLASLYYFPEPFSDLPLLVFSRAKDRGVKDARVAISREIRRVSRPGREVVQEDIIDKSAGALLLFDIFTPTLLTRLLRVPRGEDRGIEPRMPDRSRAAFSNLQGPGRS